MICRPSLICTRQILIDVFIVHFFFFYSLFFFFNHTHIHFHLYTKAAQWMSSAAVCFFGAKWALHRRGDECKSMTIDCPFSSHKKRMKKKAPAPNPPLSLFYIPSLHMDFSSQIVLCRDTPSGSLSFAG